MLVPKFAITEKIYNECIDKEIIIKESVSNFTLEPVVYYTVSERKVKEFYSIIDTVSINEASSAGDAQRYKKAFLVKLVSNIFTMMKICNTPSDYLTLINTCISLYSLDPISAKKISALIRFNNFPIKEKPVINVLKT